MIKIVPLAGEAEFRGAKAFARGAPVTAMAYDIERYLNVRNAGGASLGPDGERLSFLVDTTGTSQVWALDGPGEWPDQLTFYEERVTFADWSPTREELAFGMDEGGNERAQLFRVAGDGSEVHPLTAMPDAKHRWGGWSSDGDRFAFASNRRDEAVFDVYVQGREETGDGAELVSTRPTPASTTTSTSSTSSPASGPT